MGKVRRYVYLPRGRLTHLEGAFTDITKCGKDASRARVSHTLAPPEYPWCKVCGAREGRIPSPNRPTGEEG